MPTTESPACVLANDALMDLAQYQDAIACAATRFQWPAEYVPDLGGINDALSQNDPTLFPDGFEFTFLSGWQECAWYYAWIDARTMGDTAAEAEALGVMVNVIPNQASEVPDFPSTSMDPSVIEYRNRIAAQAALGDPTLVQDWVTNNCYFTVWTTVQ